MTQDLLEVTTSKQSLQAATNVLEVKNCKVGKETITREKTVDLLWTRKSEGEVVVSEEEEKR